MSWSVNFIGQPENIKNALNEESKKLTDQSKIEFDAALPHLIEIVGQNFGTEIIPTLKLSASGHGFAINGEPKSRQLTVSLESFYHKLV